MKYVEVFADNDWLRQCVHCGADVGRKRAKGKRERDHPIPRVFMDEPLPDQVPTVPACPSCNRATSMDEEYVACLLDVVISQTADPDRVSRPKVRGILAGRPTLRARFSDGVSFDRPIMSGAHDGENRRSGIEERRVARVLEKMCRGLAAFELAERFLASPDRLVAFTRQMVSPEVLDDFEAEPDVDPADVVPYELGSRSFGEQLVVVGSGVPFLIHAGWQEVQEGRSRYMVVRDSSGVTVKVVLSEYLFARAWWSEPGST